MARRALLRLLMIIALSAGTYLLYWSWFNQNPAATLPPTGMPVAADSQATTTLVSSSDKGGTSSEKSTSGKCVGVTDGDTIKVMINRRQRRVRLEGIDCPERGQPFGQKAKQLTSKMCFGREVQLHITGRDRYGRDLAEVIVDDTNVNQELLRAGLAWHYKRYNSDPGLAKLEDEAREAGRGLWADPKPIPPWDWRRGKR